MRLCLCWWLRSSLKSRFQVYRVYEKIIHQVDRGPVYEANNKWSRGKLKRSIRQCLLLDASWRMVDLFLGSCKFTQLTPRPRSLVTLSNRGLACKFFQVFRSTTLLCPYIHYRGFPIENFTIWSRYTSFHLKDRREMIKNSRQTSL